MRAIRQLAQLVLRRCVNCGFRNGFTGRIFGTYTERQLQSAAQLGCRTCDFWCRVVRCFHLDPRKPIRLQWNGKIEFDDQTFEVFRIPEGVRSSEYPGVDFGCLLELEGTSSESTFIRIQGWLNDCKDHSLCNKIRFPQFFMPKRILGLADNRVSLQEGARPNRYACLSHCWGKSKPPTKTLKATVEEYKKGIPWQMLNKTFQDAVDICRRLGVEYLWIDSLCIIQDSDEDWNQQAVVMGDIYSHAYFTIAATASEDSSGGCYRDRDPAFVNFGTVVEGSVYLRKQAPELYPPLSLRHPTAKKDTQHRFAPPPLLRRAWVFQEMLLSPRVLHFTDTEVIWQCNTCQKSESKIDSKQFRFSPWTSGDVPGKYLMVEGKSKPENTWQRLVSEYSGLQLSFEGDRLPALAAISQRADQLKDQRMGSNKFGDDRFLGGLWINSLFLDLLWTRHSTVSPETVKRETGYGMPSWSWASLQAEVEWKNDVFDRPLGLVSLVVANVVPIESPYLGKYSRAELILEGPIIRTTLSKLEGDKNDRWFYRDFELSDGQLALLPLAIYGFNPYYVYFLVLRPREDGNTYERVGVLKQAFKDSWWDVVERHLSESRWINMCVFKVRLPWRPSYFLKTERIESYLSKFPKEEVIIT